ncbi:MAG: COG3014 family protein, partial [Oligoflexus sp.]
SYTDETREVSLAFRSGQYQQALSRLDASGIKEQERNRLLYLLERASILDRMGQGEDSRQLLLKADRVVDQLFTTSVSKEAATYVYNESVQDYPGEDYEKVAIHTMLAHSFLEDGNLDSARVEAARINTRLAEINNFYKENKNKYKEDAYARYLAGMIFESLGEFDSAIVDYRNALRVYEGDYSKYFETRAPSQLIEALHQLLLRRNRGDEARQLRERYETILKHKSPVQDREPKAELVVIHELGQIASKERSEFIYPIGDQVVRFSFPVIRPRKFSFARTGVAVQDSSVEIGEMFQNLDRIAAETLEDRRLRMLAKSAARLILKGQLSQKAEKEFGPLGWLAANIYGAVTETADTRSWTLLPAAVSVTRVQLKPGEYDVTIYNNGRVSQKKSIKLKSGEMKLLRDR